MPLDLRASLERFFRDRRRLSPRVFKAVWNEGAGELTLHFDLKMDTTREQSVWRFVDFGGNVLEFDTFVSWVEDPGADNPYGSALTVTNPQLVGSGSGPFVRYMRGNIRSKRRYMAQEGHRCDRVETP